MVQSVCKTWCVQITGTVNGGSPTHQPCDSHTHHSNPERRPCCIATMPPQNNENNNDSFESALAALYSSEHQARTKEAIQKAALRRESTIDDIREYMQRASIALPPTVSIVHITGTKGKGSTACMCESILRQRHGYKTGLFTSPHLVDIRERIRIGGRPVSRKVFGQAYWRVRRKLEENQKTHDDLPTLPGYFRMLTVLALYIFANYEPALDVIVLEVGMGGRYDATNVFDMDTRNVVCGVTLLDLDHTRVLGDTLEQIAWEKGGIFQVKKGSKKAISPRPSSSSSAEQQPPAPLDDSSNSRCFYAIATNTSSVLQMLRRCAATEGQGGHLCVVDEDLDLNKLEMGLPGSHQRINAALATALCSHITKTTGSTDLLHTALCNASWPGRCQTVKASERVTLRLDGAHTPKSLAACLAWYQSVVSTVSSDRVLVFNCSHERNPVPLLQQLYKQGFDRVFFCPADFERPSGVGKPRAKTLLESEGFVVDSKDDEKIPTWQETLAEIWRFLDSDAMTTRAITVNIKVKEALDQILAAKQDADVLVAGSLYLVGSALSAINWNEPDAEGQLVAPI